MANLNAGTRMFYTRPSDGLVYCFEPVPLIAESEEYLKTVDERLGTVHTLTFNGYLLPTTPALSGVDPNASCLELLDRKSDQLRFALQEDFGDLLIVDSSGYPVLADKVKVISLDFEESKMVEHRKYTLVFEYETDFSADKKVRDYTETWDFSQNENDTVVATHNVSAVGISEPELSTTAVQNARTFVLTKVGLDKTNSVFIQTPTVQSIVAVNNLGSHNHVLTENSDVTAGSYSITETWILASGNYRDDRTIEHSWDLNEENELVETISINGNIQGYGDTTFDKYQNALTGFTTVSSEIDFTATSGIASKAKTENRFTGTVVYSIVRAPVSDNLTSRSISRSIERQDDGSVIQIVTTSAQVRPGSAATIQSAIDYCLANNYPLNSTIPLFNASLSGNLQNVSAQRDETQRSYSLTRSFVDQSTSLWTETYEVSREQKFDSSEVLININGTVQGHGVETGTKSQVRFVNASGAYFGTVEPLITTRITDIIPTGNCILDEPTSYSFGYNPFTGTITYSKSFTNRALTNNPNITKQEIEVGFKYKGEVVAEFQIPGKLSGPVYQPQETYTGLEKTLTIKYTMVPPSTACGEGSVANSNSVIVTAKNESDILVNYTPSEHSRGEKPESSAVFKIADSATFSREQNVFQRNVTWKYI